MVYLQEASWVSYGDADAATTASGTGEDQVDKGTESAW